MSADLEGFVFQPKIKDTSAEFKIKVLLPLTIHPCFETSRPGFAFLPERIEISAKLLEKVLLPLIIHLYFETSKPIDL